MSSDKIIENEEYLMPSQYTNNINLTDSYILNTFTGFMSSKHPKKIAIGKIDSDSLISLEIFGSDNYFLSFYSIFNYNFEFWFRLSRPFKLFMHSSSIWGMQHKLDFTRPTDVDKCPKYTRFPQMSMNQQNLPLNLR
jgi:hypothetical protein